MSNSREEILADLRAYLEGEMPYPALAARADAGGHGALARFLRAVQVSEGIRRRLMLNGFGTHLNEDFDLYVCPHCGLLWITDEPPVTCPVDETPGGEWLRVA